MPTSPLSHNRHNRPVLGPLPDSSRPQAERPFASTPSYAPEAGHFSPPVGLGVTPEAIDYFEGHTQGRTSLRAASNLSLVTVGRVTMALGLAGVYTGYHTQNWQLGVGITGIVLGAALTGYGAYRFWGDTAQFNRRLAHVAATASVLGIVLAAGGGVLYTWSRVVENRTLLYTSTGVRTAGSVLLFGAMPAGFCASEIVWGDTPLQNRVALRDAAYAHGAALLMAWAHLSAPDPPAPLWSREALQCLGIALVSAGASLARTDMSRADAHAQRQHQVRRDSVLTAPEALSRQATNRGPSA